MKKLPESATEFMTKLLDRYESAVHELDACRDVISRHPDKQVLRESVDRLLAQKQARAERHSRFARLRTLVSAALQRQVEHGMLLARPEGDDQKPN